LGGLVFFPHTRLPLRIFEPLYKQMTEDALAGNREIVIILPNKKGASGDPVPLHSVGTLGTIQNERKTPNGEILMDLEGQKRVRMIDEVSTTKLYRQADVEILEDVMDDQLASLRELQRTEILRHLHAIFPERNEAVDQYLTFLSRHCRPAVFSDVVAYSSPIPVELKQELLEEPNVDRRLLRLVETAHSALAGLVPDAPPLFPPEFSAM
jgi:Lon protease-like protein